MNHVFVPGGDFNRQNVAGDTGGEGDLAGSSDGTVCGHEEGASACNAADSPEDSAATGVLGVGRDLDGGGHPREFSRLGDNGVVGAKRELKDGHGGAKDAILHGSPMLRRIESIASGGQDAD